MTVNDVMVALPLDEPLAAVLTYLALAVILSLLIVRTVPKLELEIVTSVLPMLDAAVASTIFTSCYNSGQICTSGSRLLLNRRIHDQFVDALSSRLNTLRVGDPADPATKLGPLVSRVQYDRVQNYIELGSREYSPIVCGQRATNRRPGGRR